MPSLPIHLRILCRQRSRIRVTGTASQRQTLYLVKKECTPSRTSILPFKPPQYQPILELPLRPPTSPTSFRRPLPDLTLQAVARACL